MSVPFPIFFCSHPEHRTEGYTSPQYQQTLSIFDCIYDNFFGENGHGKEKNEGNYIP